MPSFYVSKITVAVSPLVFPHLVPGMPIPYVSEDNVDSALHRSYLVAEASHFLLLQHQIYVAASHLRDPCLCALMLVQFLRVEYFIIIVGYVMLYKVIDCFREAWFY